MNAKEIMNNVPQPVAALVGNAGVKLKKWSPELLLALAIGSGVAAIGMTVKSTLAVDEKVGAHIDDIKFYHNLTDEVRDASYPNFHKDLARTYVMAGGEMIKLYSPTIGLYAISVAAFLGAHGVMKGRVTALAAGWELTRLTFDSYRQNVVADLGVEADRKYRYGMDEHKVTTHKMVDGKKKKSTKKVLKRNPEIHPGMYARVFNASCPEYKNDVGLNHNFMSMQERYLNDRLNIYGFVFLNEVYEALGFERTKEGSIVGWVSTNDDGDGYIDLRMMDALTGDNITNDTTEIMIDPNVDGTIFDLI